MINRAPELRRPRQRRARVLANPDGQQPIDLSLELRRRRYGASHGVGLLHRLPGLEGTYAALSTAPQLFTAALRRDLRGGRVLARGSEAALARRAGPVESRSARRRSTRQPGARTRSTSPRARRLYAPTTETAVMLSRSFPRSP